LHRPLHLLHRLLSLLHRLLRLLHRLLHRQLDRRPELSSSDRVPLQDFSPRCANCKLLRRPPRLGKRTQVQVPPLLLWLSCEPRREPGFIGPCDWRTWSSGPSADPSVDERTHFVHLMQAPM
jgi:hypothetical protein